MDPQRYVARISGPLMDRFDMRVEMTRVPTELLLSRRAAESSAVVGARIATARRLAVERNRGGVPNAQLSGSSAVLACMLTPDDRRELTDFARNSGLTARGMHRVLRVARSIADLDGRAAVSIHDVTAAARLREPGQPLAASAAA